MKLRLTNKKSFNEANGIYNKFHFNLKSKRIHVNGKSIPCHYVTNVEETFKYNYKLRGINGVFTSNITRGSDFLGNFSGNFLDGIVGVL